MANLQFDSLHSVHKQHIGTIQTAQTVRISTRNDISEVLSVGVESFVNSYEATSGEVSFYGKTALRLVYTDGVGTIGSTYNADFTANMASDCIETSTKMIFEVSVLDKNVEVDGNTANINLLLEISAWGYVCMDAPVLQVADDMFVLSSERQICTKADVFMLPTVIDQQLTASQSIQTVLLAQSVLCPTSYSLDGNVLTVGGNAVVRLTYLSQNELVTDNLSFPFSTELEGEFDTDSTLCVSAIVRNTKVRLDISEEQQNTTFTAEISCLVRVEACQTQQVRIVEDAYLSNMDFDFSKKSLSTTLPVCSMVTSHKVEQSVTLPPQAKLLTVINSNATVTQTTFNDGSCTVKGLVGATLLVMTDAGIKGHGVELPFVCTLQDDSFASGCTGGCKADVTDFTLDGNVASVTLGICLYCHNTTSNTVIVSAEEIPFDKENLPAIEVFIANKGETLWNLAKSLHISTDDLMETNPQITSPLEEDTRIVIYNKL